MAHRCKDGMLSVFSESGMGSGRVESRITGVATSSGWSLGASG